MGQQSVLGIQVVREPLPEYLAVRKFPDVSLCEAPVDALKELLNLAKPQPILLLHHRRLTRDSQR